MIGYKHSTDLIGYKHSTSRLICCYLHAGITVQEISRGNWNVSFAPDGYNRFNSSQTACFSPPNRSADDNIS